MPKKRHLNPLIFQYSDSSTIQVKRVGICSKDGKWSLLVNTSQGVQQTLIPKKFETDIIGHYHSLNYLGSQGTVCFITARFCLNYMKRKIRKSKRLHTLPTRKCLDWTPFM